MYIFKILLDHHEKPTRIVVSAQDEEMKYYQLDKCLDQVYPAQRYKIISCDDLNSAQYHIID